MMFQKKIYTILLLAALVVSTSGMSYVTYQSLQHSSNETNNFNLLPDETGGEGNTQVLNPVRKTTAGGVPEISVNYLEGTLSNTTVITTNPSNHPFTIFLTDANASSYYKFNNDASTYLSASGGEWNRTVYKSLTDGSHTLFIKAYGENGTTQHLYTFYYDASYPSVNIVSSNANPISVTTFGQLDVSVYDKNPIDVYYRWDTTGDFTFKAHYGGSQTEHVFFDLNHLNDPTDDGTHTFEVRVVDVANRTTNRSRSYVIDNSLPSLTGVAPNNGSTIQHYSYVNFSVSDDNFQELKYKWGDDNFASGGTSVLSAGPRSVRADLGGLSGTQTLYLQISDRAGNVYRPNLQYTVVSHAPTITFSEGNGVLINSSYALNFQTTINAETELQTIRYYYDGQNWNSFTRNPSGTSHNFQITPGMDGYTSNGGHSLTITVTGANDIETTQVFDFVMDSSAGSFTFSPTENSVINPSYVSQINLTYSDTNPDNSYLPRYRWDYQSGYTTVADTSPFEIPTTGLVTDGHRWVNIIKRDLAGNYLNQTFWIYVDTVKPDITTSIPSNQSLVKWDTNIQVIITDEHHYRTYYSWNDPTFNNGSSSSSLSFNVDTNVLSDGLQSLCLRSVDKAGNERYTSFEYLIDGTRPTIFLVSPTRPGDTPIIEQGDWLQFTITDENGLESIEFKWDSDNYQEQTNLSKFFQVPKMDEGFHFFMLYVTDTAGNTYSRQFTFLYDTIAPLIHFSVPRVSGAPMADSSYLQVEVYDVNIRNISYRWDNNSYITLPDPSTNMSYNIALSELSEGNHTITVKAWDKADHVSTMNWAVLVDKYSPDIDPENVDEGDVVFYGNTLEFTITDVTLENGSIEVVWRNTTSNNAEYSTSIETSTSGTYSFEIPRFYDGYYRFEITVYDSFGRQNFHSYNLKVDGVPRIHIPSTYANNTEPLRQNNPTAFTIAVFDLDFSGLGDILSLVVYEWDSGDSFTIEEYTIGSYVWVQTPILIEEGAHRVVITATDASGNTETVTFVVIIDSTPPQVTFVEPAENLVTSDDSTQLTWRVNEATSTMNVTLVGTGGAKVYVQNLTDRNSGTFSYSSSLSSFSSGYIQFLVDVEDKAGNTAQWVRLFIRDVTPPNVSTADLNQSSSTLLTGTKSLTVLATDSTSVMTIEIFIDDLSTDLRQEEIDRSTVVWTVMLDTTLYTDGEHVLTIRVTDILNNVVSNDYTILLDNSLPSGWALETNLAYTPVNNYNATLEILYLPFSEYKQFVFTNLNTSSETVWTETDIEIGTYTINFPITSLGKHIFEIKAVSNVDLQYIRTLSIIYDRDIPEVEVERSEEDTVYTNQPSYIFKWNFDPDVVGYQFKVEYDEVVVYWSNSTEDDFGFNSIEWTLSFSQFNYKAGEYQFYIRAMSFSGKFSLFSDLPDLTVGYDPYAPVGFFTTSPSQEVYTKSGSNSYMQFSFNASETGSYVTKLDADNVVITLSGVSVPLTSDSIPSMNLLPGDGDIAKNFTFTIDLADVAEYLSDYKKNYTLLIIIKDDAGNIVRDGAHGTIGLHATITIDGSIPIVTIVYPTEILYLKSSNTQLAFFSVDENERPTDFAIYVNGGLKTLFSSNDEIVTLVLSLTEGNHSICVHAFDRSGNEGTSDVVVVVVDKSLPHVEINTPEGIINNKDLRLSWTGTDSIQIQKYIIYVDDVLHTVVLEPKGTWEKTLYSLAEGNRIIKVVAYDYLNQTAEDTIAVYLDSTVPKITMTSPDSSSGVMYVNSPVVPLIWMAEDNDIRYFNVSVNDQSNFTFVFEPSVTLVGLKEGMYRILIKAVDGAQNIGELRLVLVVDFTAPQIISYSINEEVGEGPFYITGTDVLVFQWKVSEKPTGNVSVYVMEKNLVRAEAYGEVGKISFLINEGTHELTFMFVDISENVNRTSQPVQVIVDSYTEVEIVTPTNNFIFGRSEMNSSGYINVPFQWEVDETGSGLARTNIYKDNVLIKANYTEEFLKLPFTSEGSFSLRVEVIDRAGNTGSDTVRFMVDLTAPTVNIYSSELSGIINKSADIFNYTLEWEYTEELSGFAFSEVWINNTLYYKGNETSLRLQFLEGDYTVLVRVFDYANNVGESSYEFSYNQEFGGGKEFAELFNLLLLFVGSIGALGATIAARVILLNRK